MNTDFETLLATDPFPEFFAAWSAARKGSALPQRSAIKLQDFARFADSLQIYELKAPRDLRCRLMGSRIAERVQLVTSDDNLFDFFFGEPAKAVGEKWWGAMAATPCGGVMCFSTRYISGARRSVPSFALPLLGQENRQLFIALNLIPRLLDHRETSKKLTIAEDAFEGKFIDIGFGLPPNVKNPLIM